MNYIVYLPGLANAHGDEGLGTESLHREGYAACDVSDSSKRFEYSHSSLPSLRTTKKRESKA